MSLSPKKIMMLRAIVDYECEHCHKHEEEVGTLQPHRIHQGGKYTIRNILMCCQKCHDKFTEAQRIASGVQNVH